MAGKKITVVISQSQTKNPAKSRLEEELAAALIMTPDVDVSLVPHLYDLSAEHTGTLFLRSVPGDLIVLSWLYPRATRWILDRNGVKGREGITLLKSEDEEDDELDEQAASDDRQGIGSVDPPNRRIYCLDLRTSTDPQEYLDEIRRIASENQVQTVGLMDWIGGNPNADQLQRYLHPERQISPETAARVGLPPSGGNGATGNGDATPPAGNAHKGNGHEGNGSDADAPPKRRWYPVIDYSRCTNCMECIDFCLFGVYGIDQLDRILVEEQDNCKKGCPACSRVCPENAILFPGHKTPAIAGADGEVGNLKIDLSALFGAPSALDTAVRERDAELVADGREAVGMAVGIPKRQTENKPERDELDDLMDGLDDLDL